ncbi:MAG: ATP synthase F1 subunit gamma [Verrucomicrobia bacterium]|nr:ATP synthase F1 subunit gamma [Verrucomicrobiota bacterium]
MATLNELNGKIASLKNTQKMTRTMKLVAASKMRRAQQAQSDAADYAARLKRLLSGVAASAGELSHPLLATRSPIKKSLILVVVSDRGLCGGFNNNLCRYLSRWLADNRDTIDQLDMSFCGRRGHMYFRRMDTVTIKDFHEGITEKPTYDRSTTISDAMIDAYTAGDYDAVYLAYNHFRTTLSQVPTLEKLLPIEKEAEIDTTTEELDYIFEPAQSAMLQVLLPKAVKFRVFNVLLENAAGEHAARMTAMDSATSNAADMIERYTLLRNRERQAAITRELIEIVTGAESL